MTRRKTNEGLADLASSAEADHELQMARSQLYKIAQYAIKLHEMTKQITDPNGLEPWQSAKLTKASDYLSAVYHNLEYNLKFKPNGEPAGELGAEAGEIAVGEGQKKKYGKMKETSDPYMLDLRRRLKLSEKAVSKSQQQAAGAALAAKRGETPKSELQGAAKEMAKMSKSDLEDIAGTKHKGLPDKKDESTNEMDDYFLNKYDADQKKYKKKRQQDKMARYSRGGGSRRFTGQAAAGRSQSSSNVDKSERNRGIAQDEKPAAMGPVYLVIDGKVWRKNGEPVAMKDVNHARNVAKKILQKSPGKDIKATRSPGA